MKNKEIKKVFESVNIVTDNKFGLVFHKDGTITLLQEKKPVFKRCSREIIYKGMVAYLIMICEDSAKYWREQLEAI